MKLNRTGSIWDRNERININDNWDKLEKFISTNGEELFNTETFERWLDENRVTPKPIINDTYKFPKDADFGDIVGVRTNNRVYMYDGTEWVEIASYNFNELDNVLTELNSISTEFEDVKTRFGDIEDKFKNKRANFTLDSNNSLPKKLLSSGTSYKLVNKISNDELEIFQKSYNDSYLRYYLKRNNGGSGYGENYELLRVQKVEPISNIVVYKDVSNPTEGSVTNLWNYTGTNSVERRVMKNKKIDATKRFKDLNNKPIQSYEIKGKSSVSYELQGNMANTMNVAMYARGGFTSNENFNIKINGEILGVFNIRNAPMQYTRIYNFNVPPTDEEYKLTIENISDESIYLTGINLYPLEEYGGQEVNQYVAYGQSETVPFIDDPGANEYAFKNLENDKLFGSYHGGEKVSSCVLEYTDMSKLLDGSSKISFDNLRIGDFYLTLDLNIRQESTLIERANMHSIFGFNDSGTLSLSMSYNVLENQTPIPLKDLWIGLTCTHSAFTKIKLPIIKDFGTSPSGEAFFFDNTSGKVIQTTENENQEIHIRHDRYNNEYFTTVTPFSVYDLDNYKKYYYAPIRGNRDLSIAPKTFQFSKEIDFYNY